jgi:uncharacterized protein (TIGR00297 family)
MAALVMDPGVQTWFLGARWFARPAMPTSPILVLGLAALAEAAADTVSSEIGQVLGGEPRMITNLRRVARGTDGGVTLVGTLAGVMAAGAVSVAGCLALHGDISLLAISWTGGVFGLFVDSFIGATLERAGWLNNDAVNFLSTASAAAFAMAILSAVPQSGVR